MIVDRVELWSAVTGEKTELARMQICNKGGGTNPQFGDYVGHTLRGRCATDLDRSVDRGTFQRQADIIGHQRLRLHVWHLVAKMLTGMGYGT